MLVRLLIPFVAMCLLLSCGNENSSGPDKKESEGIEVPCNAENEGEVVNPADSDREYVCKNSSWNVVDSSRHCEDCKDDANSTSSSSSSNNDVILSVSDKSSSSIITSKTQQSSSEQSIESSNSEVGDSSSSVETTEDESSSSEEVEDSSSSEETAMFLCDDGVTYVLDLENCEVESSSSEDAGESSSSETTTQSSSEKVEESSSSEESVESSSSEVNVVSSSSLNSIYDAINNTLTDLRDGQVYKTVVIGTQIWMAQNLNYLPEDTVGTFWSGLSVCGGGEAGTKQEGMCSIYGRLYESSIIEYDGYHLNICPDGWNIPSQNQWSIIVDLHGGTDRAGKNLKINEKKFWPTNEPLNTFNFSVLPSGYYNKHNGYVDYEEHNMVVFYILRKNSTQYNAVRIYDTEDGVVYSKFGRNYYAAIRCIKD